VNITEGNAVNTVLRYLLYGTANGENTEPPIGDDQAAREAAMFLADRAYQPLHAGHTGADVDRAWPGNRVAWGEETAADADTGMCPHGCTADDLCRVLEAHLNEDVGPDSIDVLVAYVEAHRDTIPVAELGRAGKEALG
jgi:hypothetical protein